MSFTADQVSERLHVLGHSRVATVLEVAGEGPPDLISGSLMLAFGLRETGIKNVTGDGGHGRGWLQIDDRFHQPWLKARPACDSGSWAFTHSVKSGGALPKGRVPGMVAAELYAIGLLNANARFAASKGVRVADRKRFMIAAYNCGAGNALLSYREGGIAHVDRRTANGDYSSDVLNLQRLVALVLDRLSWA